MIVRYAKCSFTLFDSRSTLNLVCMWVFLYFFQFICRLSMSLANRSWTRTCFVSLTAWCNRSIFCCLWFSMWSIDVEKINLWLQVWGKQPMLRAKNHVCLSSHMSFSRYYPSGMMNLAHSHNMTCTTLKVDSRNFIEVNKLYSLPSSGFFLVAVFLVWGRLEASYQANREIIILLAFRFER